MRDNKLNELELTILIPCLNEEKTLGLCIKDAERFLKKENIKGEILIADNGSTDNSIKIAKSFSLVRVVRTKEKGYGANLINGINNARGKYTIFGDADYSYDFLHLELFMYCLNHNFDLVMGNRFKGGIEKGAMPILHYPGTKFLSLIGRILYHNKIYDYNCGLRGINTIKFQKLNLKCKGMEFASEMIIKASKANYKITEIPTQLRKDKRDRRPYLNTFKDGFRHLKILLNEFNK